MNTMLKVLGAIAAVAGFSGVAAGQDKPFQFSGASCTTPPPLHCPDKDCPGDRIINPGAVVEMKTRRTYFLDYPCDLRADEKVTVVLNLHGGGSYGNWTRHYFPLLDFKDKYRLVVATPNSPTRVWSDADDEYLKNIVTSVYDQLGKERVKAFWLAGHSQGGQTSNRLLLTDFFRERLTGWVSLSGGRLGSKREDIRAAIPGPPPGAPPNASTSGRRVQRHRPRCDWQRTRRICPTTRSRTSTSPASTSSRRRVCRMNRAGRSDSGVARANSELM